MKDVCVVTAYQRPEMLHECLTRIHAAKGHLDLAVHVCVDGRTNEAHNPEVLEVAHRFDSKLDLIIKARRPHSYLGNSHNTLEGLKEAFHARPEFVFLVEDDVMVAKDFFHFHYAAQALTKSFASIAVKCTRRNDVTPSDDPSKIWISGSDYASLGVCFSRDSLSYIIPYANENFYRHMHKYCEFYFPNSRFRNEGTEQDGLLIRIMGHWGKVTAWPYVPRAYHSGYYSYHRLDGSKPTGTLEQRIENFKKIMFDPDAMAQLGPNLGDIHPCNLDGYDWDTLDIDETFG